MNQQTLDKILKRIETYGDEAVTLETELTKRPALGPENGGNGEVDKAEYIEDHLTNVLKCRNVEIVKAPDERVGSGYRPNIIAIFPGNNSETTLWIMSHLDVVPPGESAKWSSDPWHAIVKDGKIYGRGTEDNQQGVVSSILAARALVEEGVKPERNLGLLLVADEETGSKYGVQHILETRPDLIRPSDLIIIPDAGNADGTMIEIAEKSIIWLKIRVEGEQTHASTPKAGNNAFKAAASLIVKLNNLYMMYNAADPLFEPTISTFEPTKREANVENINTIPGEDVFYFDCRLLPNYDVEQFIENVRGFAEETEKRHKVKVQVTTPQVAAAAPPTPANAPVVKALQQAILAVSGAKAEPKGIGGGTVAAFFRKAGLPAAVWATQDDTLHGPNEYAKISNILNDARIFAHVALQQTER